MPRPILSLSCGSAALALLALMLSGCAGPQKINAWPAYYRESDEAGRTTHAEVLWPFGELDRSPEFEQWAIRPLVNHRVEHADDTTEWQALFPLVRFRKSARTGRRSDWVFPLYSFTREQTKEGIRSTRLTPWGLYGQSPKRGPYYAGLLWGTVYEKLGYDEIHYITLLDYIRTVAGPRQSVNYLFPFYSYTWAGDYRYRRLWPFYGRATKEGKLVHCFVLWPFFSYQVRRVDVNEQGRGFLFFPFVGIYNSPKQKSRTVLWPFFSYQEIPGRGYESWSLPAPLVRFEHGRDIRRVSVWPFFGHTEKTQQDESSGGKAVTYSSSYVLWPLYSRGGTPRDRDHVESRSVWPFYKDDRMVNEDGSVLSRTVRLWPLFRSHSDRQGAAGSALSPLPFQDPGGLERNWGVFWRLFETERRPDGGSSTRVVHRLVVAGSGPGRRTALSLGPLLDWEADEQGGRFTLLGGLLELARRGDSREGRLFYTRLPSTGRAIHNREATGAARPAGARRTTEEADR